MKQFTYVHAESVDQAIELAVDAGSIFLAGGTNLVDLMRLGVAAPDRLIDVSGLHTAIESTYDGGIRLGAGVANTDVAVDARIRRDYPALSQALLAGASGQIRNLATVGGNLLQRTRCRYFQDVSKPCNKRLPGSGCPARSGIHRDLAILGTSDACIASHPSDMAVALATLDAVVVTHGPAGRRRLTLDEFYRLPGDDPTRDTTLAHGELIEAVELPPASPISRASRYRKARDRASFAFAVGAVAASVIVDGPVAGAVNAATVTEVRLAFGAVAPKPWRARIAEAAIRGRPADREAFRAALADEFAAADVLPDNAFKAPLCVRMGAGLLAEIARIEPPPGDSTDVGGAG